MTDLRARLVTAVSRESEGSSDFDFNKGNRPAGRVLRAAGVLIAVTEEARVILTMRSSRLKHHPGQIAFPGGKQEPTDASLMDAALREAEEEVGLSRNRVDMIGPLPPHETVTGFSATPFVAMVQGRFDPVPEAGEVAEVFEVPLDFLADPGNYRIESREWQGQRRSYLVCPYGPYYIWGATARMLRGLADRLS
ncbi:CoA pyrophosphatase [Pelagovum pacificum]|uniref:CoA pyrophosphatase n=1 Tax=Pelagovum pacificum TaxID=2588711 RepID=A0A5C5GIF0_9RHOB|nr:CoA pyrophosphatase [Pelagovum pacificum]QQA42837.1 CoA pyrophosphatase [Pelagovum pacificum]TNY34014.1 CoA pyrophosphatase [Pelagovum pacificum]